MASPSPPPSPARGEGVDFAAANKALSPRGRGLGEGAVRLVLALAFCATFALPAYAADYWGTRLPNQPTQFIFGYGSLINRESRDGTAGHHIEAVPARISAAFGYLRSWNDNCPCGFTALGLRVPAPGEHASTINGVVYPVEGDDLSAYDARESSYRRVRVPNEDVEPAGWQPLPAGGTIWIYVPKAEDGQLGVGLPKASAGSPVVESYVDVVLHGALDYGPDFARELIATTTDWSEYWLNDRDVARRPWVFTKDSSAIDRLLRETEPAAGHIKDRLFSEPYAARWLLRPAAP